MKIKPKLDTLGQLKRMDPLGIFAFIPAIVSILLGLQWAGTKYDWDNARIIALFVLFGVFGSLWCYIQVWKQDEATVPPRLLKNRNVLGAVIHATFLGGSFFVFGYYVSPENISSTFSANTALAPHLVPSSQGRFRIRVWNQQSSDGRGDDCLFRFRRSPGEHYWVLYAPNVCGKRISHNWLWPVHDL